MKVHNIAICLDDSYCPGAIALINSIKCYHKGKKICINILYDNNFSNHSEYELKRCLEGYECNFIKISISKAIPKIRYFKSITCGKLYIAEYLDVDRCLYLDCDTICLCNLEYLFNKELNSYSLGAVIDPRYTIIPQHLGNIPKKMIPHRLNEKPGLNSGVLIIDINFWKNNDYTKKTTDWIIKNQHYLTLPDQAAINFFIEGKFQILEKKWNVCLYKTSVQRNDNISILHFNGQIKPWMEKHNKFGEIWRKYYGQSFCT